MKSQVHFLTVGYFLYYCSHIFRCRRDSFITHRAFCDALTEENNKMNQGLHQQMPNHDLMPSSMPMINNTNSSNSPMFVNDFSATFDSKNPLKSLPKDFVPLPFKPNTNNLSSMSMMSPPGMFSTTSGTLFGGPRGATISSSSSSLQLSPNTTAGGFNYLQESKVGGGGLLAAGGASSAHMSATALLQKAAQMGATASNSINSPMMHQKSFMAGPDQQQQQQQPQLIPTSSAPPLPIRQPQSMSPYSISNVPHQHHSNNMHTASFNHHPHHGFQSAPPQAQPEQFNQLLQKSNPHDHHHNPMPHVMENANAMMSGDMGMFSSIFMGVTDHHNMKNPMVGVDHEDSSSTSFRQGRTPSENVPIGSTIFEGNSNKNISSSNSKNDGVTTTLDLLGLGVSRHVGNLHEHQQQQRMEMEGMSQQRMPAMMGHFAQQLSHGESAMEKSIWDA